MQIELSCKGLYDFVTTTGSAIGSGVKTVVTTASDTTIKAIKVAEPIIEAGVVYGLAQATESLLRHAALECKYAAFTTLATPACILGGAALIHNGWKKGDIYGLSRAILGSAIASYATISSYVTYNHGCK